MQTGENEQALRKILDMTRLISIVILILHFYFFCYLAFVQWNLTSVFGQNIMSKIFRTGLFDNFYKSKFLALLLLMISIIGAKGRKDEKMNYKRALVYILIGLFCYWTGVAVLHFKMSVQYAAVLYITITASGFLLVLSGGTLLSRIINTKLNNNDVFNRENETFPQEERLLENDYSINLPARYQLKNKIRSSWINIINPFRGLLVLGSPGSGKSYFVIRHVITQHIKKGFSMFVYDFKYDDLSKIVYNTFEKYKHVYKVTPTCYFINFDKIMHRCNPLDPKAMDDITDASESARTILMGLNREWIKKQGDFFVESPINFLSAVIWYLKRYKEGEFCTLPHVIELMQVEYENLFSILRTEKEIEVLINPFISAFQNDAMDQLEGQIGTAKIAMARLSSPQLYYVLSGNDFSLDINNPQEPKIVCMGNNPQKIQIYGAVLSLYVNRLVKLVNKKDRIKSSLIFDEFPTIYLNNMDSLIATARSNKVSTCLGIQDFSQLRKDYGREQADVIMNITGNIISGQVTGDTSKQLSERFGKIMQDRESLSINSSDTSISRSKQLEVAVPPSKIASLSSGEFVGMVADNPDCKIDLKTFHCEIVNDHQALKKEEGSYKEIPPVRNIDDLMIQRNYLQIKQDVQDIINSELENLLNDPAQTHLIIKKKEG
ncbi:conjugal transfer protein MobC [Flavobacterium agrisoli]|uniref:Type IV secretory system conjugative DNA transfer family protein n=1 Tax=Flavobacterium agrisoli TaxID=2793066 RepID=A0A934PJU8_9FLAO|nr:conjugal transfer protein MobC [Flavobacterium agrisoli]MBK0368258.1 type IV secretory system conjugative DNA transfer family protein [Flavobacterium agrisoli]